MDKAELLSSFADKVDKYQRFRSYIDKAKGQSGKFSLAVIEKVCLDNELKSQEIGEEIRPLIDEMSDVVTDLTQQRDRIIETKSGADANMEEMQLRNLIGELTDDEFEDESSALKEELSTANERLEALESEIQNFQGALDRWVEAAEAAGHDTGLMAPEPQPPEEPEFEDEPEAPPEPAPLEEEPFEDDDPGFDLPDEEDEPFAPDPEDEPIPEEELDIAEEPNLFDDLEPEPPGFGEPDDDHGSDPGDLFAQPDDDLFGDGPEEEVEIDPEVDTSGEHAARVGMVEDMSAVFGEEEGVPGADDDLAIEVGELAEDDGSVDIDIGVDEAIGDELDILSEAGAEEVEIDLLGAEDAADIGVENGDAHKGPRRALLLYQEGTPEEQIYPFTSDVITIGRGRENDIQIKNDSKVSRYHCKIFRRGDNFYIEDNKSSNGSLVNGELITERRLFGGEEIVIGETFFRFRIME